MLQHLLLTIFAFTQILYSLTFFIDFYLYQLPVDWVRVEDADTIASTELPLIILFYPVLRELEETMRTTMGAIVRIDYPPARFRIIAIPNQNDAATIISLERLTHEFDFLEILAVPPTSDPSWQLIWDAWSVNRKAYWWHEAPRAGVRDLPPKKTRQLIYAFYHTAAAMAGREDFLVNYIDADSCPPVNHFKGGAAGMLHFDVLQSQNVAGNLLKSLASTFHSFDHMCWDGSKYPHLSANGRHPYWVLGKGLFFRASDLTALGGFHPWMAIEDPEVGMRFWINGKRLGILSDPLIEEVPETFLDGITQRKRWVCGFFQSLSAPLDSLGFTPMQKFQAWLNFLPCLLLSVNVIGLPPGLTVLWLVISGSHILPLWLTLLSGMNVVFYAVTLLANYIRTWHRTGIVLHGTGDRIAYMLRINPLFQLAWWLVWLIPLWIGFRMYVRDGGLVWDRTRKVDANHNLILSRAGHSPALSHTADRPNRNGSQS
jgi:cellulose synthase/poly-beta-1,6-N-acetylglucosamine synthase-like glycosyltransferase